MLMQLFITDYTLQNGQVTIHDKDIIAQLRKVLRVQKGDHIALQGPMNPEVRHTVSVDSWTDDTLVGTVIATAAKKGVGSVVTMCVAMPNKWDKAELIVQKLSEIGVRHIYFRAAERSIIKQSNPKKMDRIAKISKEAVEQSWGWQLPTVGFVDTVTDIVMDKNVVVFDIPKEDQETINIDTGDNVVGVVGPEGGLTTKDYTQFGENYMYYGLGETVLRTETAAIVSGRLLQNK